METSAAIKGVRCGYKRVSSVDQNTARQLEGVQVDKMFVDHCSGKDTDRPNLKLCLEFLRAGDTLVVHSMDRLARNLSDLLKLVEDLTKRGIVVEFVKEHLSFTGDDTPMSRMLLAIMGAVAEFERAMIRERQAEGIALAKKDGKYAGRKRKLSPVQADELRLRVANKAPDESVRSIAREYGFTPQTLYSYLKVRPEIQQTAA